MARLETRSVTCKPEDENAVIQKHESFGWTLESSQEIFNKDSHIEARGESNYSITETVNYVKLIFKRDKDMPYYEEVSNLEQQYDSIEVTRPAKAAKVFTLIFGLAFFAIGLISTLSTNGQEAGPIFLLILGVTSFITSAVLSQRYTAASENADRELAEKRQAILDEVKNYV